MNKPKIFGVHRNFCIHEGAPALLSLKAQYAFWLDAHEYRIKSSNLHLTSKKERKEIKGIRKWYTLNADHDSYKRQEWMIKEHYLEE